MKIIPEILTNLAIFFDLVLFHLGTDDETMFRPLLMIRI